MKSIVHDYLQPRRKEMTDSNGKEPAEQTFQDGASSVNSRGISDSRVDSSSNSYSPNTSQEGHMFEVRNVNGHTIVDTVLNDASNGRYNQEVKLFAMQVRRKDTGEIIYPNDDPNNSPVFTNVYNWSKRSITIFLEPEDSDIIYPKHPDMNDGDESQLNNDNKLNGKYPYREVHTITFPYDIEVYEPGNPRAIQKEEE